MIKLKYGNTNTFFLNGLLIDTDYAGTLPAFYKALKRSGLGVRDLRYVLATHYHPDHVGLIGELARQGVRHLLIDVQTDAIHASDYIFARERLPFVPLDASKAQILSCAESRVFLAQLGIAGEIIPTPSHSPDSVSLVLDDGDCIVGDLEPFDYLEAYEDNAPLQDDWARIASLRPKRIFFAHMPEIYADQKMLTARGRTDILQIQKEERKRK